MQQKIISFQPYTQWETGIRSSASACGPAAMAALIRFWEERIAARGPQTSFARLPGDPAQAVNRLYAAYGGTPLGMGAPLLARGLRRHLGAALREGGLAGRVQARRLRGFDAYCGEIDAGRLVAVKFDKWFALRWFGRYAFDYHWTVGCGYRIDDAGRAWLIVHDAGTRYKDGTYAASRERLIEYAPNRSVLTMVALTIEGV
ncbi:hypothetical protein QWJ34_23350 [Saccharibacillus sp. CPCC 101409]|uniref:hypothetical protein n=1 Tax=Saccharibacillus sp. CPCC 101409 TaxID=3058041 RepID=UPI002671A0A1|nr:hypothetical protein [Saccharibacillus sp. CPCC 101409]MDO3412723.1 hypothetical protein [Saccharibacillus sp. CPCC 101409]